MEPLFFIRRPNEILDLWGHKPKTLSLYSRKKLSLYEQNDMPYVSDALQRLTGCQISAEALFFSDSGQELYMEFPELAEQYIAIADDGQGDLWLMNLQNGEICFFDHGEWEHPLTELHIDFKKFVQLADLIAQWECFLNTDAQDTSKQEELIWDEMRKLDKELPEKYPFSLK